MSLATLKKYKTFELGFNLVEIMVAVVIIGILTMLILPSLGRDSNRTALRSTTEGLQSLLVQAQGLAMTKNQTMGVCYKKDGAQELYYAQVYTPALSATTGAPTDSDCLSSESLSTKFTFKSKVKLCSTAVCAGSEIVNTSIFFGSSGRPISSSGNLGNYQICLKHLNLDTGSAAREIEVTTGGTIQIVKLGQAGDISSLQANAGACL